MLRAVEREWRAMVDAIRTNASIPVTGAYGRHIIACIEATLASSRDKREMLVVS
jgi:predicted dehydrogenase